MSDIPPTHWQIQPSTFDSSFEGVIKILGLQWQASTDSFSFTVSIKNSPVTKRILLSEIARIYDPLGFIGPLSFFVKRLIQHLWVLGLDWDEAPPANVCEQWDRFKAEISSIQSLLIPRYLFLEGAGNKVQLHGFCDASQHGYAAVLYIRFVVDNEPHVRFLMSKSKVAPLKSLSIPRLELCGALLLSKLTTFVLKTYSGLLEFDTICAWTDSMIVLNWIKSSPHRWKTFVANRVSQIQEAVPPRCWRHVRSADNPADKGSRGLFPEELMSCSLWWAGPPFLSLPSTEWPVSNVVSVSSDDMEESKCSLVACVSHREVEHLFEKFSSLRKIQGSIAYCFRWLLNYRSEHLLGELTAVELHRALLYIVKMVQHEVFAKEIDNLRRNRKCSQNVRRLSPFLDQDDILRVGGRLKNSSLPFETKHPALLPRDHILTDRLIDQIHNKHGHPGVNTVMYLIQQNFFILSARRAIRHRLSGCYMCFRVNPKPVSPTMGDLPAPRVSQVKAFSVTGVDYGGHFSVTQTRRRGAKTSKAYLCLFVCFATKGVHLEIASDLSTATFLAALRRFIARRGRCSKMFSDCGTNFVGASRELIEMMKHCVEAEAIEWSFNPPSAPHFGGLWESGIKSVKSHMIRIVGNQILTFEELTTLVAQVEASLNSRPLCPLSSDPNDISPLTPGHFLTLEPLTAPPDPDLSHLKESRLSRWQLVQRLNQIFWRRWPDEYLHTLYQRSKWYKTKSLTPVDIGRSRMN